VTYRRSASPAEHISPLSSSAEPPVVRLDSAVPGSARRGFVFEGLQRILTAHTLEEVVPALSAVEEAVARGAFAVGYVAYEAAAAFEPALAAAAHSASLPLVWFAVYQARRPAEPLQAADASFTVGAWHASRNPTAYARQLRRIREWIAAGDTYQVNYTLRLRTDFAGDARALYQQLLRAQPGAYCAYLDLGEHVLLSASPELFFRWSGEELELRPMKGTRRRGRFPAEDVRLARELLDSPKERAENLMIVDLLRNDAGRVARFGSVAVPRLFQLERYPTVHQLTSTIRARTRPGTTLTELFRALFPSGSVTGAPKIRTMQIIAATEQEPRGVYTGAIGFAGPDEAVFSVAIRTLVLDRRTGRLELGVGGGITFDSEADAEYAECLAKAAFVRQQTDFQLLETLGYDPATGFFLRDAHLSRLAASAEYFGFDCDLEAAGAELDRAAAPLTAPAKLRLRLSATGELSVRAEPLAGEAQPVRVRVAPQPVDSAQPLLYHKTSWRAPYERRLAACPDCDDVLLVNERGELTESTIANLVVRLEGVYWTPPVASGLLPGVFRQKLLADGVLRERVLYPADLSRADSVYLINSVRGWRRIVLIT
jgi:para-aminobenzoate synthetase / 4-amino-4-deoxychorismate lyase